MGGGGSKEQVNPFPIANFQEKLLQPPDDDSVRQTWIILRSAIDAHVRRFYHSDRVYHEKDAIQSAIREHGIVDEGQEAEDLATLLHAPKHRRLGLRIAIARVMVSSIDFYAHPDETSLEPAVVELMRKFRKLRPELEPEEEAAFTAWRMITAFFLQPAALDLRTNKHPCVDTLERFLVIFARNTEDKEARMAGLNNVANRAIELGEKFFCHQSRWLFEWRPPSDAEDGKEKLERRQGRRDIVLFPALMRSDDEGVKERGNLKYVVIKRKAVSAGAFFGAPVESSDSESSREEEETPPRGRRMRAQSIKRK